MKTKEAFSAIKFKDSSQHNLSRKLSGIRSGSSYKQKICRIAESGPLRDWWNGLAEKGKAIHKKALT
ncbi:MAG: hypothetical protein WCS96_14605 [Victivallales bacterium]|jgi:hypothetical protein